MAKKNTEHLEDYEYIFEQVLIRAAKDYRNALKRLYRHPENPTALATKKEIERFFRSEWFQVLSDIDPNVLIEGIKVKVTLQPGFNKVAMNNTIFWAPDIDCFTLKKM